MEPKTELQKNAIALARRQELESYQRALDVQWMNNRMEDGRMGRCLALIQREAEMEKDFQQRTDHSAIVNARCRKETDLAIEVAKVKQEEACNQLRRHYLRERDPALRDLTKKLQAGYVCRDLKQQILHNEYRKLQEKAEELRANTLLMDSLRNEKEEAERLAREKFKSSTQYRNELQNQLVNREQERQCQYEDTLIEKKMLEDIMRTIADEDQRELELKREQMLERRREMQAAEAARAEWRRQHRLQLAREQRRLQQQQHEASDTSANIIAERKRILKQREDMNEIIGAKILADEAERHDREDIIKQLQEQEYLEKNHQDDLRERTRQDRVKVDTMESLTAQKDLKKLLDAEQIKRDADYRKEIEAKQAIEEAKELEKERIKKEKNKKYTQELLQQIEDNARRKKLEQDAEAQRAQNVWDHQKAWQEEATQERKNIIQEHAPHLIGYLQSGVLKHEDLPNVKAGAAKYPDLAQLDIDAMGQTQRSKRFSKCNAQCRILREF